jgi:hypothetical protein
VRTAVISLAIALAAAPGASAEPGAPTHPAPAPPPAPAEVAAVPAPGLPDLRRARAASVALRYRRATDFDGGTVELAVRRPLATRWWADATLGLQLGATGRRRAITLVNPRLGAGVIVSPGLVASAELGLPAVGATGDGGALATAHTDLAVVEPAPLAPRTTSLTAALSPHRAAGKAAVQARLAAALLVGTERSPEVLLHLDVGGTLAVAGPVHLAAGFATTSYALADVPDGSGAFVHRLSLAAQVRGRGLDLTAGVAAPVDRRQRDRDLVELTVTARATW